MMYGAGSGLLDGRPPPRGCLDEPFSVKQGQEGSILDIHSGTPLGLVDSLAGGEGYSQT